jgi:hypothetical protein
MQFQKIKAGNIFHLNLNFPPINGKISRITIAKIVRKILSISSFIGGKFQYPIDF